MQDTSGVTNYDTINALPHTMETKVNIAGVDYGEDVLIEVSTSLSLFTNDIPRVGSCSSGEIDIRAEYKLAFFLHILTSAIS